MARRVSRMPVTAGKSGIWSGAMPSDAAIGGRVAYAVASVGESHADLRPDQYGTFQRACVPGDTSIAVRLRYPGLAAGETISIGVMDGGELQGPVTRAADKNGAVDFTFVSGPDSGSHRIMLGADGDVKILDFWVGPPEFAFASTAAE